MPVDACCAQSDTHRMNNKKIVIPKTFGSMAVVLKRTRWCRFEIGNATKHPAVAVMAPLPAVMAFIAFIAGAMCLLRR